MIKYTYVVCIKASMWFVFAVYVFFMVYGTEVYSEPCQTEMDPFAKIVNE